jgi:HEAT repeat protein
MTCLLRFYRIIAVGVVLIAMAISSGGSLRADSLPADPVEDLRQALRIPVVDPLKNKAELEFRRENLTKKIEGLHTIGQLRRAIALNDWLDEDQAADVAAVDRAIRSQVAIRLRDAVKAAFASGNPVIQKAAVDGIAEMGVTVKQIGSRLGFSHPLTPDIANLVRTGSPSVQIAAARALGSISVDPEVAAPALGDLLRSPAAELRRAAASALGNMIKGVTQLLPTKGKSPTGVESTPPEVIQVTVAAVPKVGPGLTDPDPEVRRLSADAILQAALAQAELVRDPPKSQRFPPPGRKPSPDEHDDLVRYRKEVQDERDELLPVSKVIADQVPGLVQVLVDANPASRVASRRAAEEMAHAWFKFERRRYSVPLVPDAPDIKPVEATDDPLVKGLRLTLPNLVKGVDDPDLAVREATVDALEMLSDEARPVAGSLVRALGDPNPFVRWAAARTLGRIAPVEDETAVPALARLLQNLDLDVRIAAATALQHYGPAARAAVPDLTRVVNRGDAEIRVAVIRALEGIGTDAAPSIPVITAALADPNPRVRLAAADVLGHFGALARDSESALRKALDDSDADVRRAASDALLSILATPEKLKAPAKAKTAE